MITLTSIRRQLSLTAALATILTLTAGTDIAEARGSGGPPSHSQQPSSVKPVHQGSGSNERREGTDRTKRNDADRKRADRNGQAQKGCNKRCQTNKTTVVISDPNGKVLDRIPGPITSYSAEAVAGGIALHVNGNTYTIAGTQVAVKNEALSTYGALLHGLNQTLIKGPNGTFTTVLTVTKPPLKGL